MDNTKNNKKELVFKYRVLMPFKFANKVYKRGEFFPKDGLEITSLIAREIRKRIINKKIFKVKAVDGKIKQLTKLENAKADKNLKTKAIKKAKTTKKTTKKAVKKRGK